MGWLILYYTLEVLKWLIIVRAVLSWFMPPHASNTLVDVLRRVTDPILRPIQSVLPDLGGVDVSPLVAFFLIIVLQGVIARAAFF
jgi:YggT family protein